jgi:hypothetical protein
MINIYMICNHCCQVLWIANGVFPRMLLPVKKLRGNLRFVYRFFFLGEFNLKSLGGTRDGILGGIWGGLGGDRRGNGCWVISYYY